MHTIQSAKFPSNFFILIKLEYQFDQEMFRDFNLGFFISGKYDNIENEFDEDWYLSQELKAAACLRYFTAGFQKFLVAEPFRDAKYLTELQTNEW